MTPAEAVIAGFTLFTAFLLGAGYWKVTTRQNEQEARIEQERSTREARLAQLERDLDEKRAADNLESQVFSFVAPHLSRLRDSGPEATNSQRLVVAASEYLASKGRPGLAELVTRIRTPAVPAEASAPRKAEQIASSGAPGAWLVVLATVPGDEFERAEDVAREKRDIAATVGTTAAVGVYKTKIKGRYVITFGEPRARDAAFALAAEARRTNVAGDAFAEQATGWVQIERAAGAVGGLASK